MNRTVSMLAVACFLAALPLAGCGEDNEKTADLKGEPKVIAPGEDASPEGQKKQMKGIQPGAKSAGGASSYPKPTRN